MKKRNPNHVPSQVKTSPKNDVNSILPSCEKLNLEKKMETYRRPGKTEYICKLAKVCINHSEEEGTLIH